MKDFVAGAETTNALPTAALVMPTVSTACAYGISAGHWSDGLEWQLNETSTCPSGLPRYLRLHESCLTGNGKRNLKECVTIDHAALAALQNASLLFFGDSTAYRLAENICSLFHTKLRSTISVPTINRSSPYFSRAYKEVTHQHDHHFCRLLSGGEPTAVQSLGLPIGAHTHYGVAGEPFWAHAYPRPPWLGRTTAAMARDDLPAFCRTTHGCEPTLVVLNSAFWDISAWWLHPDNERNVAVARNSSRLSTCHGVPKRDGVEVGPQRIRLYIDGLRHVLTALRHAFPSAAFAWRTAHVGLGHGITRTATQALNRAVIANAPTLGLRVIDVGAMIEQLSPRNYLLGPPLDRNGNMRKGSKAPGQFVGGTIDGRHLHPYLDSEVFNLMLAELGRAWNEQPASARYPTCSAPSPPPAVESPPNGQRLGHGTPPGQMCATRAARRPVPSMTQLYRPLPMGECASVGCSTMHCLCKHHDRECTKT